MSASHLSEITDSTIVARLLQVAGVSVNWTSPMPSDAESWDDAANLILSDVGVDSVRKQLELHELHGDDAASEIDMAISMACEPDDLPEGACVDLQF